MGKMMKVVYVDDRKNIKQLPGFLYDLGHGRIAGSTCWSPAEREKDWTYVKDRDGYIEFNKTYLGVIN